MSGFDSGADETYTAPNLSVLDDFNRANATNLNTGAPAGVSWSQAGAPTSALRVNTNQAFANLAGQAIWNNPTAGFGANQGAGFTMVNIVSGSALMLKATGGTANSPTSFIRVVYQTTPTSQVIVSTTTNGATFTTRATFSGASATFASGDTLRVLAYGDGTVYVYKTSGAITTLVGSVTIPTSGAGSWAPGTGWRKDRHAAHWKLES